MWTLQRGADSRYTGRAADVLGEAVGQSGGNAFNWRYTLLLPVDGHTLGGAVRRLDVTWSTSR